MAVACFKGCSVEGDGGIFICCVKAFQELGWDIHEPVDAYQCLILRYAMLCIFILFLGWKSI